MNALLSKIHIFILLYAGWYYYDLYTNLEENMNSKRDQVTVVENSLKKAIREKDQMKEYFKDVEQAKQNIEIVAQEVEKIQRKLPNRISDTENLDLIKGIAEKLNIKNIFLAPGIEKNKGFYFTKAYEMKGTGTFLQFLILLEKISINDRLLNITDVTFDRITENQRGRFQLINAIVNFEAYRYNPEYKEDRGIKAIEDSFSVKKAPPKRNRNRKNKRSPKK